jgi:hypothetical protein
MLRNSLVITQLAVYQDGLSSMELVLLLKVKVVPMLNQLRSMP